MIALTATELAEATGGVLAGIAVHAVVAGAVVTDSRDVEPGGLFVALGGEHVGNSDRLQHAPRRARDRRGA